MGEECMRPTPAVPLLCRDVINRRALLRLAAQAGVAVFGAASPGFAQQQQPFKIGWIRPTTGRLASSFAPLYFGGLVAVDEINAAGGILGRQIARVEEDDEASPAKEPGIVRKLREQDIGCFVGPTGSSQSLASIAATTSSKVVQSTYAAAAEAGDGRKYPYHYQIMFNTDQQADVCVDYMVQTLGLKKIGSRHQGGSAEQIRTHACQRTGVSDRRSGSFGLCRKSAEGWRRRRHRLDRQRSKCGDDLQCHEDAEMVPAGGRS
jgi:branched-chain amino acid transport system substrate-binding protein